MAWALQFDGVDDRAKLDNSINIGASDDFELIYEASITSIFDAKSAGIMSRAGTSSTGILLWDSAGGDGASVDGIIINTTTILFGSSFDITALSEIVITRETSLLSVTINGNTALTSTANSSAINVLDTLRTKGGNATRVNGGYTSKLSLSINGVPVLNLDPGASDRSGSTDQPILTDTVGSNDATGFNFPSFDASVWVNLGGGSDLVTPNNASHTQSIDQVVLTENSVITINGASHSQTINEITLQQLGNLSLNDVSNAQTVDNINLTENPSLLVDDLKQQQTLNEITLSVGGTVSINNLEHIQTIDEVVLTQAHIVTLNEVSQSQTIDGINFATTTSISVNDASQSQALEQLVLSTLNSIDINNASQSQIIDALSLTQANVVSIDNLSQNQLLESITFGGVIVGYLKGELTIISAYNGQIKITNPLSGEVRIL